MLNLIGHQMQPYAPGLGVLLLVGMVLTAGAIATHVIGQRLVRWTEATLERIPLIRSIYLTLKSMTDLLNYKARFGQSTVVAFPFPRDGLWALGLVMGPPPQRASDRTDGRAGHGVRPHGHPPLYWIPGHDPKDSTAPAEPAPRRGLETGILRRLVPPLARLARVTHGRSVMTQADHLHCAAGNA